MADYHANLIPRPIFGGAMEVTVPEAWLDTDTMIDIIKRPVPDNQEMFVAPQESVPKEHRPAAFFVDICEVGCA